MSLKSEEICIKQLKKKRERKPQRKIGRLQQTGHPDGGYICKRCSTSFVCVLGGGMPTKITWRFGGDGNNANKKWAKDVKRCFTSRKIRGQQISSSVAAVLM